LTYYRSHATIGLDGLGRQHTREKVDKMETIISLQEKLIAAELAAIAKHGKHSATSRKVIFAARTRFKNAVMALGFDRKQARDLTQDANDMVILQLESN